MAENIFPSAGRKYDVRISRVASENSLFPTQKIYLYMSIYVRLKTKIPYMLHPNSNATLWYPCVFGPHLQTYFPGKKPCLGNKIQDSTVPFVFAPIVIWSDTFGRIRKSRAQLNAWNHARTFTCFPFFVGFA